MANGKKVSGNEAVKTETEKKNAAVKDDMSQIMPGLKSWNKGFGLYTQSFWKPLKGCQAREE